MLKQKIKLDFNILKLQTQIAEEKSDSNAYRIALSNEIYIKNVFERYYGKQIADLISYIKFRNFEIGKSKDDLNEILLRLEVKVDVK